MTAQARGGRSTTGRAAAKKPAAKPDLKSDPDLVVVDLQDFTAAEIETIEEITERPIARASDLEKPQGKMMRVMAWVIRLRADPTLPYEDDQCDRGARPSCAGCHCSRRLKVAFPVEEEAVPPSGGNDS